MKAESPKPEVVAAAEAEAKVEVEQKLSEIHSEPLPASVEAKNPAWVEVKKPASVEVKKPASVEVKKPEPEPVFEPVSPTPLPEDSANLPEDDFIEGKTSYVQISEFQRVFLSFFA